MVAIDVKASADEKYNVFIHGGRTDTGLDACKWAQMVANLGAGEILLASMDADGTKAGFDLKITKKISQMLKIPVIASGGAGKMEHILDAFKNGADAALAASIFHYKQIKIKDLKNYLSQNGVSVRL